MSDASIGKQAASVDEWIEFQHMELIEVDGLRRVCCVSRVSLSESTTQQGKPSLFATAFDLR